MSEMERPASFSQCLGDVAAGESVFELVLLHSVLRFTMSITSEAAECADEQDMFWEYHDGLFENQDKFSDEYFYTLAEELGLDTEDFTECLSSGAMTSEVRTDYGHGVTAGVRGTPAFFVNGELVSGAQPASSFASMIDPYL